ncbi:hypothetical protein F4775DRAFT_589337 [Biscogniauxia sp. FL1348]|nr:hypothetical protein F4775DRAFT_589337 [Biscogniauxia sp. FL1348]
MSRTSVAHATDAVTDLFLPPTTSDPGDLDTLNKSVLSASINPSSKRAWLEHPLGAVERRDCQASFDCGQKAGDGSSIAILLLRIAIQRSYRYPLWFVIIATIIGCVVPGVVAITLCRPLSAQWDPSAGTCGDYTVIINLSYAVSVITVVTDYICAITPGILIRSLNITRQQKVPLMITLSLGILASTTRGSADIPLWCVVEGAFAFIAGSLAPVRKAPALLFRREIIKITYRTQ